MILVNKQAVVQRLRLRCWQWLNTGRMEDLPKLRRHTIDCPDGARVMFTRDSGHHTCGWFKNPDYERCLHLSISYRDPETMEAREHDLAESREWCRLFFGQHVEKVWTEPPYSEEGKARDVWHFRVFCDPKWDPWMPRGEVYTRKHTPPDWKSWSELQAGAEQCVIEGSDE